MTLDNIYNKHIYTMIKFFTNLLNPKTMAKAKMKTCSISGKNFKATNSNFYVNKNTADGLHPYHKTFDNIRRTQDVTTQQLRSIVNLINKA